MHSYELSPLPMLDELTTILAESDSVRIEKIVSTGQTSGLCDQEKTGAVWNVKLCHVEKQRSLIRLFSGSGGE